MTFSDLVINALDNLYRRKSRTLLNLLGVVVSCVLLLLTLASASGVRAAIARFVEQSESAKRFQVATGYDRKTVPPEGSVDLDFVTTDERMERLRNTLYAQWRKRNLPAPKSLSSSQVAYIENDERIVDHFLDFESAVQMRLIEEDDISIAQPGKLIVFRDSRISGASRHEKMLKDRLIAGEFFAEESLDGVLIHEMLAYELGVRSDEQLQELLGKRVQVRLESNPVNFSQVKALMYQLSANQLQEIAKLLRSISEGRIVTEVDPELKEVLSAFMRQEEDVSSTAAGARRTITREFAVRGVFRNPDSSDPISILTRYLGEGQLVLHHRELGAIAEELKWSKPRTATVYIDDVRNLESFTKDAQTESLDSYSAAPIVKHVIKEIDDSRSMLLLVVLVILIVSAFGISNTMIMSVMERSQEIGIMKAVGGSNKQVTWLILFEGAVSGAIGGGIAVLLSYVTAFLGSFLVRDYVQAKARMDLDDHVVSIEAWMILVTLATAIGVSLLASLYPARQAAVMDPVDAMRR